MGGGDSWEFGPGAPTEAASRGGGVGPASQPARAARIGDPRGGSAPPLPSPPSASPLFLPALCGETEAARGASSPRDPPPSGVLRQGPGSDWACGGLGGGSPARLLLGVSVGEKEGPATRLPFRQWGNAARSRGGGAQGRSLAGSPRSLRGLVAKGASLKKNKNKIKFECSPIPRRAPPASPPAPFSEDPQQ